MRILVFSDTHGRTGDMLRVLEAAPCDLVLHLGDCTADCDDVRLCFPQLRLWQVAGNDFRDGFSGLNYEDCFVLEGVGVFMAHGHRQNVSTGPETLCACAEARGAALALYGHTHRAALGTCGGVTYFNPGSLSRPRDGSPSYGVVTVRESTFHCEVVRL